MVGAIANDPDEKFSKMDAALMLNDTKRCSICGQIKVIEDFYKNLIYPDGFSHQCKSCTKLSAKLWNKNHKYDPDPLIVTKQCFNCEQEKPVNDFYRDRRKKDGYSTYCKPCYKLIFRKNTLENRLKRWRLTAKYRKLLFSLSISDLEKIPQVCHYTGVELTLEDGQPNTISLDRIDSSKGYTPDNVVFCCGFVNIMKTDLSLEQFVFACRMVVEHHDKHSLRNYSNAIIPQ